PDHVDLSARRYGLDSATQSLLGTCDEITCSLRGVTDDERAIRITVHSVAVRGDVDVDDVAILQHRVVGDAMADDLVDRAAERFRKSAVPECRRIGAVLDDVGMPHTIKLVCRHARPDPL